MPNIVTNLTSPEGVAMAFSCVGDLRMNCGELLAQLAEVGFTPTNASVVLANITGAFQGTCRFLGLFEDVSLLVSASQASNGTVLDASGVASDFIIDCNWKSGIVTMAAVLSLAMIGGGALAALACGAKEAKKEKVDHGPRATATPLLAAGAQATVDAHHDGGYVAI